MKKVIKKIVKYITKALEGNSNYGIQTKTDDSTW